MSKPSEEFQQAYDNFLAGCDVDTTMLDCAEFMFNAGRESVSKQAEPVAWAETDEHGEIAWGEEGCFSNDPAWIENPLPLYTHPAQPVAADQTGLIKRSDAAIERVTQGRGLMSIPADPRSDVDLVMSECKALLQGKNPPFWATDFHPAQPVAVDVGHVKETPINEHDSVEGFMLAADIEASEPVFHNCTFNAGPKLVRLTEDALVNIYLECKAEWKSTNKRQRQRIAVIFGNAIMDALLKKNGFDK